MLNAVKHPARAVGVYSSTGANEMLRYARHDVLSL